MNTALLEKIRRLRALSTSSNVHEAAAAAAAAERLIQEHNIDEAELEVIEVVPVAETSVVFGKRLVTWQGMLVMAIEKNHGCAGYYKHDSGNAIWVTVGRPQDIETVKYLFAWLSTEIVRLSASVRGRRERNSFCMGAVAGLKEAMLAAKEEVCSQAALVAIDARIAAAESQLPSNLKNTKRKPAIDRVAYSDGVHAGRNIHQRQGLGHGGTKLLT